MVSLIHPVQYRGGALTHPENIRSSFLIKHGRRESNLQPPVLETGALPIELRPYAKLLVGETNPPKELIYFLRLSL